MLMNISSDTSFDGLEILGEYAPGFSDILTPKALDFVAKLSRQFESRRRDLMAARSKRQADFDAGRLPDFLPDTQHIREATGVCL